MVILIDYDNLVEADRRNGPRLLLEKICERIVGAGLPLGRRLHARFYGGWYEGQRLSRRAESLSVDIQRDFPAVLQIIGVRSPLPTTCELALSLDIDPGSHFYHTFRRQSPPLDVKCNDPRAAGCMEPACPVVHVQEFLDRGRCSVSGCSRTAAQLLFRSSQKLVDSMLTVDLMTMTSTRPGELVSVVSSDDDLWPGIHGVLHQGITAVQVHTKPGGTARHPYVRPGRAGYISVEL
jgi:hypothetical protein